MTERITAFLTMIALIVLLLATFGFARAQTADPIEAIREHYAQINRSATNYKKVKKNLSGFSTEGGELVAYFHGPSVMKMVATFFGEMGKATLLLERKTDLRPSHGSNLRQAPVG